MLQKLYIKNYAIIDELSIDFQHRLTVITGETGAGKSIILGAFSLILGERADTSVILNKDLKSIVEAHFDTHKRQNINSFLQENDLDVQNTTIIRREISAAGKSRAFINDTPVTLDILSKLASKLVDLHRQFDNHSIADHTFQYHIIDAYAENLPLLETYKQTFLQYNQLKQQCELLKRQSEAWKKEVDYKQFLFEELEHASLKKDELEAAETQLKQLSHAEQIQTVLLETHASLEQSDQAVIPVIRKVAQQFLTLSSFLKEAEDLAKRLESTWIELKDIANEAELLARNIHHDQAGLLALEERLDLGYRLMKKHGVTTTNELIDIYQQLSEELNQHHHAEEDLEKLLKEKEVVLLQLQKLASQLLERRKKVASVISRKIVDLLTLIDMPNANFQISIAENEDFHNYGKDSIAFLFDANRSGRLLPVQKAASGGEMSRIMLSIKSLTADSTDLPTLIFDEVDTGISGEASLQVANLLNKLASHHQILCITHQPQVAAKGEQHLFVYKQENEIGQVNTRIRKVEKEEKIKLIATMIGGNNPSEKALENARELVEN